MADMDRKGRRVPPKGIRNTNAKITADIASEIREMYKTGNLSQREIGEKFGIKQANVSRIIIRKYWSDQI